MLYLPDVVLSVCSCTGVQDLPEREKAVFTSPNREMRKRLSGQQKTPIKSGFLPRTSFSSSLDGGGRWIRTIEGIASRFTVCPLWPLGNSPILIFISLVSLSRAQRSGSARKRKTERADTKLSPPRRKRSAARFVCRWSWWTDSNPRPADYKSAALPAELHQHLTGLIIIAKERVFVNRNF